MTLSYALVTPARNEEENLRRLARSLVGQSVLPAVWVIVDSYSSDDTVAVAAELAQAHRWVEMRRTRGVGDGPTRANATLHAFATGVEALAGRGEVVVKLDADVSIAPDYFERLLEAFAEDPSLGIGSGTCYELDRGKWRQRYVTAGHVWGASRAYRRECLEHVWPLEDNLAWDKVDEVKATLAGWRTRTLTYLPFYHHRREGEREARAWRTAGDACHYLGYRLGYLLLRSLNNARRDPAALAMITGYLGAALRRAERCPDDEVRSFVRSQQTLRQLPHRAREALGRSAA